MMPKQNELITTMTAFIFVGANTCAVRNSIPIDRNKPIAFEPYDAKKLFECDAGANAGADAQPVTDSNTNTLVNTVETPTEINRLKPSTNPLQFSKSGS